VLVSDIDTGMSELLIRLPIIISMQLSIIFSLNRDGRAHSIFILPRILVFLFMATLSHDPRGYFPTDEQERISPSIEQCIVGDILTIALRYTESNSVSSHSHTMLASCGLSDCRANLTHSSLRLEDVRLVMSKGP